MSLTIDQQIKSTYIVLRVGAAAIGFALPLLLWGGGKVAGIYAARFHERLLLGYPCRALPLRRKPRSFLH